MVVHLSGDLERLVREKVDSGHYRTADEVIDQALRALDERKDEGERPRLGDLPAILASLPHLDPADVEAFEADLSDARREAGGSSPRDPWESRSTRASSSGRSGAHPSRPSARRPQGRGSLAFRRNRQRAAPWRPSRPERSRPCAAIGLRRSGAPQVSAASDRSADSSPPRSDRSRSRSRRGADRPQ
jgi:putative addiction module CopG family antidote